jgi:hypothetical protein
MTYAWFTEETVSSKNTITSGFFDLDVDVTKLNDDTEITPTNEDKNNGTFSYTLPKDTYNIVLDLNDKSTAKGYCIVKIDEVEKHTYVIIGKDTANREEYDKNEPFKFTLIVTEDDTVVEFKQHWGVSATPSITANTSYSTDYWNETSN